MHKIQQALLDVINPFLDNLQKELWQDYEIVLLEEEAL